MKQLRSVRARSLSFCSTLVLAGLFGITLGSPPASAVLVQLVVDASGATLVRNGSPYTVKGAGGDASFALLAASGANTARTWGVGSDTQTILDNAQANGLAVAFGIWLGHTEHGFNYHDPAQLAAQLDAVRDAVLAYKDHPAVLVWGIGNEMEGFGAGDDDAVWNHVEACAALVKSLDPNHPTMTTIAEIGGERVAKVHALCPSIDIVGINSYGGIGSIPARYADAGGTKPYLITEFGIWGSWETGSTSWGAPREPTSTAKGPVFANAYNALDADPLCLGSIAFIWGDKREATLTWHGMFLADGSKLQAVDDMTGAWGGPSLTNRCPRIVSFSAPGDHILSPAETLTASLVANDPDADPLTFEYRLYEETEAGTPGDDAPLPPDYPASILSSGPSGATITAPPDAGPYRLYVFLRDGNGAAATANIPLYVDANTEPPTAFPVTIYDEGTPDAPWAPTGYMGSTWAIDMDFNDTTSPHAGSTALRVQFNDSGNWGGVVWQNPMNNWGSQPGGIDLSGATALSLWARGESGGEHVTVGYGLYDSGVAYPDSSKQEIGITLSNQWTEYTIPLDGRDMSSIVHGFHWILTGQGHPLTFYFDDIRYVAACSPADLDANATLNLDDINAFASAFVAGNLAADLDDNAALNLDDINAFASAFVAGCP